MGSSESPASPSHSSFETAFTSQAGEGGMLSFAQFMDLALYHSEVGYYAGKRKRVGYGGETDFYTASTSGSLFGELVAAACVTLLGDQNPREFTFVEIGAENGQSVLRDVSHPFAGVKAITFGQEIILSGQSIVFSNELFDAQPFHRFVFRRGQWRELGVQIREGEIREVELPVPTASTPAEPCAEGYIVDAPYAAVALATKIGQQPWTGLFVACDYGKSWRELIEHTPHGSARAYYRHQQSNDLYVRPGKQDLTCHVCWDWLEAALQREGFQGEQVESQEAFFIRQAGGFIARTTQAEAAHFSQRKLSLLQLLHPSHLGQKFQVLHARR